MSVFMHIVPELRIVQNAYQCLWQKTQEGCKRPRVATGDQKEMPLQLR